MNREKTGDRLAEGQSFELTVPLVVRKGTSGFRPEIFEPNLGVSLTGALYGEPTDTGFWPIRPEIRIIPHVLGNRELLADLVAEDAVAREPFSARIPC